MYALVRECLVKSLGTPRCDAPVVLELLAGCRKGDDYFILRLMALGASTQQHMQFVVTAVLVVLMHLVVLGASDDPRLGLRSGLRRHVLMHLLVLGAF